jgi:hypothetical protein
MEQGRTGARVDECGELPQRSARSFRPARPLCPVTPKAGVNGDPNARDRYGRQDDDFVGVPVAVSASSDLKNRAASMLAVA